MVQTKNMIGIIHRSKYLQAISSLARNRANILSQSPLQSLSRDRAVNTPLLNVISKDYTTVKFHCKNAIHDSSAVQMMPTKSLYRTFASSTESTAVSLGDRVSIYMTGKLENGDGFGSTNRNDPPISFIVGSGEVLVGIEKALIGMKLNQTKEVIVPPRDAFGERPDRASVYTIPKTKLNIPDVQVQELEVDQTMVLQDGTHVRIVGVTDTDIEIDLTHPYAGKTLILTLELMEKTSRENLPYEQRLVLPDPILKQGDGIHFPRRGDTCIMHYEGKLTATNEIFDTSNTPFSFQIGLGHVIKGWDEGVMHMSKGEKSVLQIPSVKGYGKDGAGDAIPPNADLTFTVELLDIIAPKRA